MPVGSRYALIFDGEPYTWTNYQTILGVNNTLVRDSLGNLHAVFHVLNWGHCHSISSDDGLTWSTPHMFAYTQSVYPVTNTEPSNPAGLVIDSNDNIHYIVQSQYHDGVNTGTNTFTYEYIYSGSWSSATFIHGDGTRHVNIGNVLIDSNDNIYIVAGMEARNPWYYLGTYLINVSDGCSETYIFPGVAGSYVAWGYGYIDCNDRIHITDGVRYTCIGGDSFDIQIVPGYTFITWAVAGSKLYTLQESDNDTVVSSYNQGVWSTAVVSNETSSWVIMSVDSAGKLFVTWDVSYYYGFNYSVSGDRGLHWSALRALPWPAAPNYWRYAGQMDSPWPMVSGKRTNKPLGAYFLTSSNKQVYFSCIENRVSDAQVF